ncbi:Plasmid recombination enzyme [Streptococcus gallolyticus subsp. gallolyticus ATCC BAA-2069]|uniref:MobV family relaxase n=1 Tax=Streptococcus gallolyticus TaxID=315405 RepID=UPI000201AA2E|nr:MobV family relaxase [Streptococcus gallolyticus]CBZ47878.1 Plasmid recombination enzyme [Streptococcus gallolyticus subsp. gallolyticus ATCC BAA-2069]
MSYVVARMEKYKSNQLSGIYNHNERVFKNHSNKDIDPSRSHLNYELTNRDKTQTYHKQIKEHINENRISSRGIRKDAVLCNEWVITSDKTFFESLDQEQTKKFFESAKNYFAEKYGEANIAYASVHLDESTPHMHLGIVPMKDGKLSSKALFGNREKLREIQDELPKYLNEQGYNLQRGEVDSKKKHLKTEEFKEKQKILKKADEAINKKNCEINNAKNQLNNLQNDIDSKKQALSELENKEWETVGTLERYEKEIKELSNLKIDLTELDNFNLDNLQKNNLIKRTFDGKLKMDKETFEKLYHTAKKNISDNTKLKQELNKLQSENNQLSRNLLSYRKTSDENLTLKQENRQLKDKVKNLDSQVTLLNKKVAIWREKAKEFMPKPVFQNTLSLVNSLSPIGLAKTVVRQVKNLVDKNS